MNLYAVRAIYRFEMARAWRTLFQSLVSPVLSTSLYFIVFGAAIGSRIAEIDGISVSAVVEQLIRRAAREEGLDLRALGHRERRRRRRVS